MSQRALLLIAFATLFLHAQVHAKHLVHVDATSAKAQKTALLIMNGFGGSKRHARRNWHFGVQGMDVFIPEVCFGLRWRRVRRQWTLLWRLITWKITRRSRLSVTSQALILLHTHLVDTRVAQPMTSIVYDRSPMQERAPRAVIQKAPLLGNAEQRPGARRFE
jgi:hypothetical protein